MRHRLRNCRGLAEFSRPGVTGELPAAGRPFGLFPRKLEQSSTCPVRRHQVEQSFSSLLWYMIGSGGTGWEGGGTATKNNK